MIHQSRSTLLSIWITDDTLFFAMFGTIDLYIIMYSALHTRVRPQSIALTGSLAPLSLRVLEPGTRTTNRATRYIIIYRVIYPAIYMLCILPPAAGRVVALTG